MTTVTRRIARSYSTGRFGGEPSTTGGKQRRANRKNLLADVGGEIERFRDE